MSARFPPRRFSALADDEDGPRYPTPRCPCNDPQCECADIDAEWREMQIDAAVDVIEADPVTLCNIGCDLDLGEAFALALARDDQAACDIIRALLAPRVREAAEWRVDSAP